MSMNLSRKEFDRAVRKAIERIPEEFRVHLENILISVQDYPSREMIEEAGFEEDEGDTLLGLFRGDPLMDRSYTHPPLYPDTILIFQKPLEAMCEDMDELEEEIAITVIHEIAHYLGIDEERLSELGYD